MKFKLLFVEALYTKLSPATKDEVLTRGEQNARAMGEKSHKSKGKVLLVIFYSSSLFLLSSYTIHLDDDIVRYIHPLWEPTNRLLLESFLDEEEFYRLLSEVWKLIGKSLRSED